jgi:predicted O-methyltransferase YrrM
MVRLTSPRRVLELGSYRGATAAYLARAIPEGGVIVAVDIDPSHGSVYRGTELEARIERRVGSIGPDLFKHDLPGSYDLVFVDASHKYEDVRRDNEIALALVAPDGHVVWHDYANFGYFNGGCEVPEALHDLARTKSIVHVEGSSLAIHSPAWPENHLSTMPR